VCGFSGATSARATTPDREHERHVEQERGDEDRHDGLGLHGREDSIT